MCDYSGVQVWFYFSPQSMGEVMLITDDGTLHLWKLDTGYKFVVRLCIIDFVMLIALLSRVHHLAVMPIGGIVAMVPTHLN